MPQEPLKKKLTQLRELMQEALSGPPPQTAEGKARRAFQHYEDHAGVAHLVVPQTPRGRAIREIDRIATWYCLPREVSRALDAAGASCLAALQDDELDQLLDRMRLLEDNIQNGGCAPDAPAAR